MAKLSTTEMIDSIKELSVLELNELVKAIEEEFGVSAAAPVAAAGGADAAAAAPTTSTVMLTAPGQSKVQVIKAVKTILGLGLMDAKKLVDSAPVAIKENLDNAEAEELKAQLEAAGASVELK